MSDIDSQVFSLFSLSAGGSDMKNQGDGSGAVVKTRYTIQRLIKQKKSISLGLVLLVLSIASLIALGFGVYIFLNYKNVRRSLVSFDSFSQLTFDLQKEFLYLSIPTSNYMIIQSGGYLPPAASRKEWRDFTRQQYLKSIMKTKNTLYTLKSQYQESEKVWREMDEIISSSFVTLGGKTIQYERGIQDVTAAALQYQKLEDEFPSDYDSISSDAKKLKGDLLEYLNTTILQDFYQPFKDQIEKKMVGLLDVGSTKFNVKSWLVLLFMSFYYMGFFCILVFIDIKFTRNRDRLVRLFYGFHSQDCKEIIKRCQKLVDKVEASQFGNDEELLAPAESDQNFQSNNQTDLEKEALDDISVIRKKRKGKGTLVKIFSLKNVLAFFYITGNFIFKMYCEQDNSRALDEQKLAYMAALDIDRYLFEAMAGRGWLEKAIIQSDDESIEVTNKLTNRLRKTWTDFQKVIFSFRF